ncbi:hypothetical protein POUND7_014374 [Theobroma cacao]
MREAWLGFSLVIIACLIELASSTVVLKPFSLSFTDLPAKFARGMNNSGVCGALEVADPLDACTPLRNEFSSNRTDPVKLALIIRGDCSFEEKIRNAQRGGFSAAIVYDDRNGGNLIYMMMNPKGIEVQAVFVSKSAGEFLKDHAKGEMGECCIYAQQNGRAWTVFAICFLSLVVIAVFLVIAFIAPRSLSNWRGRNSVRSVDTKMVEALPRVTFSSARLSQCCTGETCAICLEDYEDGEILKVLPCQHDFHSSCVESWLTKWGTFCPVCKLDMATKIAYSEIRISTQYVLSLPKSVFLSSDRSSGVAGVLSAREGHPHQKFISSPVSSKYRQEVRDDADCGNNQLRLTNSISSSNLKQSQPTCFHLHQVLVFPRQKKPRKQPQDLRNNGRKSAKTLTYIKENFVSVMGSLDKSSGSEVVTIDVIQAKSLLQSGYGYIDVRTVEEYKKGHVDAEKILNIPYMFNTPEGRVKNPEFLKQVSSFCKEDDLLVVGCQSGVRSLYATADLLTIGFKNVSNMGGGYLAWVDNGFPLKMEEPVKVEDKHKEEL